VSSGTNDIIIVIYVNLVSLVGFLACEIFIVVIMFIIETFCMISFRVDIINISVSIFDLDESIIVTTYIVVVVMVYCDEIFIFIFTLFIFNLCNVFIILMKVIVVIDIMVCISIRDCTKVMKFIVVNLREHFKILIPIGFIRIRIKI